ncbi:hypothetical protein J437_LFUL001777 [Ladona fulva]|uniref:Uncharacterized protein n=1 Tax=Ladona fulva TaxID=123851 RepID=A0A8K0NXR1_LADFU|nr:hypothetical protein J437_LFUL001777 [Ladona fulva]
MHAEPDTPEFRFNSSHMAARNCVLVCGRAGSGYIINTCAVLHNMALYYRVPLPQDIQHEEEEIIGNVAGDINITREGNNVRRSVILNHFS